jgi:hypothetical protein
MQPRAAACGAWPTCLPGPAILVEHTVVEMPKDHVTLDLEGIARLYLNLNHLNLYRPQLQTDGGGANFVTAHGVKAG